MKTVKQLKAESILERVIVEIITKSFGPVATVSSINIDPNLKSAKVSLLKLSHGLDFKALQATVKAKIGKSTSFRITPKLTFAIIESEFTML